MNVWRGDGVAQTPSTRRAATAWKAPDTGVELGYDRRLAHGRRRRDGRRRVVGQIGDFGADLGRRGLRLGLRRRRRRNN